MLEDADRRQLKEQITHEIGDLEREIERLVEQTKPIPPDRAIGRLTRMEAIQSKSISEANLAKARQRLRSLKRILPRIDDDEEYGLCRRCEEPIPIKRLLLVPESAVCVRCLQRQGR